MGGAPTVQGTLPGTLSDALPQKQPRNNRDDNWGRRLVGHPHLFYYVCIHSRGVLYQRERERERERESETPTKKPKKKKKQVRDVDLDVVVDEGERVVGGGRVQDGENTRGTTNRLAVCGSPAPERREKKRDATTANKKHPDNKRRERDPKKMRTGVGS